MTEFAADVTEGAAPLDVTFTCKAEVVNGTMWKYRWYFGDGMPARETHTDALQASTSYTFTIPGTYTVRVTALSTSNSTDSKTVTITVGTAAPTPTVSGSPTPSPTALPSPTEGAGGSGGGGCNTGGGVFPALFLLVPADRKSVV